MELKTNEDHLRGTHNTSRYFVENPQIAWAVLIATLLWGAHGYMHMPQRKDPEIAVRVGLAICTWPGATTEQMEQLVTRPIEDTIAQNKFIHPATAITYGIRSTTGPGQTSVLVQLGENVKNTREQFNDIASRLQTLNAQLPRGASPIQFQSDFGDTVTLMLTVASPPAESIEVQVRANEMRQIIAADRAKHAAGGKQPVSIVYAYPLTLSPASMQDIAIQFQLEGTKKGWLLDGTLVQGNGFVGVDGLTDLSDSELSAHLNAFIAQRLPGSMIDPDIWPPIIVHDLDKMQTQLGEVAGSRYSYHELDNYTDLLARSLRGIPEVSRVERSGILLQQARLEYSQERLAAYGLNPSALSKILAARNITAAAGSLQTGSMVITLNPTGRYDSVQSIGNTIVGATSNHVPVYLRDLVDISEGYEGSSPTLNYYTWIDMDGKPHRDRAVTLSVFMRSGEQVRAFGEKVNQKLEEAKSSLPADLVIAHTSDQPLQVKENIHLFMTALYEAIILVVLVALIGFWDWRSALLMALAIPLTLAMTFGFTHLLGVDLQQVSIATLIIALGLLVDDPVVANDAIKREMSEGASPEIAGWLGPTKLATTIVYATATNIIGYLPFLLLNGNTGDFLHSLPVVMTASLVASRLVSMTFIPLLAKYLLKLPRKKCAQSANHMGIFYAWYKALVGRAIEHRWVVFLGSGVFIVVGLIAGSTLKSAFFPDDVQYWSYVDLWLPDGTTLSHTNAEAVKAQAVVTRVLQNFQKEHPLKRCGTSDDNSPLLASLTTFVGAGAPRFWFSVTPQLQQSNYAQIVIRVRCKEATPEFAGGLQTALTRELPGVQAMVHQLQINGAEFPVEIRISSISDVDPSQEEQDNRTLRQIADKTASLLQHTPGVALTQPDWLNEAPEEKLELDMDRSNLAGLTNDDVTNATLAATDGLAVTALQQANRQIPIVLRLRTDEQGGDNPLGNIYVSSSTGSQKVLLGTVASVGLHLTGRRIIRRDHFRTVGVHAFLQQGVLASEVMKQATPGLNEIRKSLPKGYTVTIGGEGASQSDGFLNLVTVLLTSIAGIYGALLLQFRNAVKPLLVFAAVPYGVCGSLLALAIMGTPFGFMAFLGIVSLIGVIVSHIIVLFDYIEEMRAKGEPLKQSLQNAGVERLRPVLITVGATIFALVPLAIDGGPLWRPLCYAQIGGLGVATFITLLLVPALYTIAVLDLKIVKWDGTHKQKISRSAQERTR